MDRLGAWLWRAHSRHYVGYLASVSSAVFGVFIAGPSVAVAAVYLDLTLQDTLVWGFTLAFGMGVSVAVSLLIMRRRIQPVLRWVNGQRDDPVGTWSELIRLPEQFAACVLLIALPIDTVLSYTTAVGLARPDAGGVWGLAYAYVMIHLVASVFFASGVQLANRVATEDVVGFVTEMPRQPPTRWWTVRLRLVVGCFGGVAIATYVTPLLVLGSAAETSDYLIAGLGGCALAAYVSWLMNLAMIRPTVVPMADLMRGTIRVRKGDIGTPVTVATHDEFGDLAIAFNEMQRGLQERESLQNAFGSYVDPSLAKRLLESGSSVFEGEDIEVTVMFADVRDFTSYAEGVDPGEAVALLNRLFDVIVPIVQEAGGHTNHYLGDGLLAVFGAPQPLVNHAEAGVAAAIAIQRAVCDKFGGELRLGIGINTGRVIAGTVGGGGRHEFTVIGDTVNVAARVEQLTKDTGDGILVTESTHRLVDEASGYCAEPRGAFDVRGKTSQVTLHAVNPEVVGQSK